MSRFNIWRPRCYSARARGSGTVNLSISAWHTRSAGRFDEALARLLLDVQDVEPKNPGPIVTSPHATRIWGDLDEAREMVERVRAITPLVVEDLAYLRDPEQRAIVLSGLRLAVGVI